MWEVVNYILTVLFWLIVLVIFVPFTAFITVRMATMGFYQARQQAKKDEKDDNIHT